MFKKIENLTSAKIAHMVYSIYTNAVQDTLPTNIDSITTKILFIYEKGAWMINLQSIR
jgi:hypothetical protein